MQAHGSQRGRVQRPGWKRRREVGLQLPAAGHGCPSCIFSSNHSFLEPPPWGVPERRREEKNSSSSKKVSVALRKSSQAQSTAGAAGPGPFHRGVNTLLPGVDFLGWKKEQAKRAKPAMATDSSCSPFHSLL